jgi:hypothetical protein
MKELGIKFQTPIYALLTGYNLYRIRGASREIIQLLRN